MTEENAPFYHRHGKRIAAALIVLVAFSLMKYSAYQSAEVVTAAASRFHFTRAPLPEVPGPEPRSVRSAHPDFRHMATYISSVGAAAAFMDADGDALANDICYVETRTDQVIITPAPGTGARYQPFELPQPSSLFSRERMSPMGCQPGDLNEDGHMDYLIYYAGRTPLIFLGDGAGHFTVQELVPGGAVWVTGAVNLADLDGDGHLDLVVCNYFADGSDIYNPRGQGHVYFPASLSRAFNGGGERVFRWTGATAGDKPSVSYTEVPDALPEGVGGGWGLAAATADIDGDLLPELYVAHDFGPDRLFHNISTPGHIRFTLLEGESSFMTPHSKVLGRDSFKGMGAEFADINGDGIPDIFVSNITEPNATHESQYAFVSTGDLGRIRDGVAPYVDRSEQLGLSRSGWAWDIRLADFDNDGVLEVVQATGFLRGAVNRWPEFQELGMANDGLTPSAAASWPQVNPGDDLSGHDQNPFFVRVGERYVDVSRQIGFTEDYVSRAIATSDVDGDGALDMVVGNMWGPSTFYHNDCSPCGAFLGLRLLLPLRAEDAPGLVVRDGHATFNVPTRVVPTAAAAITLADGRRLFGQLDGSNGHSGKRSPELHFGLGRDERSVRVDLKWRDAQGKVQEAMFDLKPGWHTILLGSPESGAKR